MKLRGGLRCLKGKRKLWLRKTIGEDHITIGGDLCWIRLTKMVAQMHAAIVESRAMLESSERRATAAEGLVAKLAVDKSGGERQASDGVLRSVDEQKSNIPSRFDQTSGDSQMGVNNEIDSGHPSGTTDLEEPSGGSTIAKLICELRELESEARSLLASQELDVSELAAQQQQQQQHKVN